MTFQETRTHLGVETQRQWSDLAIARTTPVLLGLFSIVTLLAHRLARRGTLPVPQTAWYAKQKPTFSDAIAFGATETPASYETFHLSFTACGDYDTARLVCGPQPCRLLWLKLDKVELRLRIVLKEAR